MRFNTCLTIFAILAGTAFFLKAGPTDKPAATIATPTVSQDAMDKAVKSAVNYLRLQIGDNGKCTVEYPDTDQKFGGKTALCVYALLTAEVDHKDPSVKRAVDWLVKQKLTGTYAVAMRACALAAYYQASGDAKIEKTLKDDLQWLIDAANKNGAYTYTSSGGKDVPTYDNSNTQAAMLGVWSAAGALGVDVPRSYWQTAEKHWLAQQQPDGGWGYLIPKGQLQTKTYGSMTAGGLASLYVCYDNLRRDQFVKCTGNDDYKPIDNAVKWLADRFDTDTNPGLGVEHYYYWLFSLERVALASGQKYLGGRDWYALSAADLLDKQTSKGAWGYGDGIEETSFALMFLARGRHAVLLNKLSYEGKWNPRPRDAANFSSWMSRTFEQNVGWQIVRLDAKSSDLHDAPILYISGAGPCELSDAQIDKIRDFVYRGGIIVSESAGNNGDFTLDIQKLHKKLFPQFPAAKIKTDNVIHSANFKTALDTDPSLVGVSNGARLLAIHCPNELSLGLQLGYKQNYRASFELLGNISLYVTDKGSLPDRWAAESWPVAKPLQPKETIAVARLKYSGNYDPEPLAWRRIAILMGNRQQIKLDVSEPMEIVKLDACKWPVAAMTGTDDFTLTDVELQALKKYLESGGTLILDATGGGKAFTQAVERQITTLLPEGFSGLIASSHAVLQGPAPVKIAYRRELSISLGSGRNTSRLRGVQVGDRLAILYSPDDLTAGMVGYHFMGINGYTPDTAAALMTNMLIYAASGKVADKRISATSTPATMPTTHPTPTTSHTPASSPIME